MTSHGSGFFESLIGSWLLFLWLVLILLYFGLLFFLLLPLIIICILFVELIKSARHRVFFRMKHASTCPVPVPILWSLEKFSWLCLLLAGAIAPEQTSSASQMIEEYAGIYGCKSPHMVVYLYIWIGCEKREC